MNIYKTRVSVIILSSCERILSKKSLTATCLISFHIEQIDESFAIDKANPHHSCSIFGIKAYLFCRVSTDVAFYISRTQSVVHKTEGGISVSVDGRVV